MESDIKDLAGCRIIFYTNDDVSRFMNSGLMHDNFAIIEVKVHHPNRDTETAAELYMANHYVVKLRPEREALPEYARFAGMRCEVQVHTILNHAWAEIAHDMLYKKPRLSGFGGSAFGSIDGRMHKVMRKYLLPAGYEFQKILGDFERLCLGKDLFDRGALDAIIHAKDNNERADALERFSEHVLPGYDDVQSEYPQIVQALVNAATIARNVPVVEIETPYGSFRGKTAGDITRAVAEILGSYEYRYVDVELTFDALSEIFLNTATEDEWKPLLKVAESLSKYDLQVWNSYGPAVQAMLISRLKKLPLDQLRRLQPLLIVILREILKTQVTGTSSTSSTFTRHTGAVVASQTLAEIRHDAIGLLKQLFHIAQTDVDRRTVLNAFAEATRTPSMGTYSNQLVGIVLRDSCDITSYYAEIARNLSHELLQVLENRILQLYRCFRTLPSDMANDPVLTKTRDELVDSIQAFRDGINSDRSFVIFKALVGFDSVFPPAWENDQFDYQQAAAYQNERLGELLNDVEETNSEEWFAIITQCAATQSNDRASFRSFGEFLIRLGETKPDILLGYLDRMDENLARFVPAMLSGLIKSPRHDIVLVKVDEWVGRGQYLGEIAWHLRSSQPFDERLLLHVFTRALDLCDGDAVLNSLWAAVDQYKTHSGTLVESVFLPAIAYFASTGDTRWAGARWRTWHDDSLLASLDADQATTLLRALIPYPDIEYSAEEIVAALATRWPQRVIEFFDDRLTFAKTNGGGERYRALPFSLHDLREPLAAAPEALIDRARRWFDENDTCFRFQGGQFVAQVFPDFDDRLRIPLKTIVQAGDRHGIEFVLAVLHNYEGKSFVDDLCKDVIEVLDDGDALLREAAAVLTSMGMSRGEFGIADAYARKKSEMGAWLDDPREKVRRFASKHIHRLAQYIADEHRSAEERIALRKLDYGEELIED